MTTPTSATAPLCLACGEHTVKKDRRVLGGTSERVTLLWKETISSELEKRKGDVDLDELLCPGQATCAGSASMRMTKCCRTKK